MIEINGQYPAAPIQVTEGALVHVKVNNNLFGAVAPTIHWHGFKMSDGYYWYVILGGEILGKILGAGKIFGGESPLVTSHF